MKIFFPLSSVIKIAKILEKKHCSGSVQVCQVLPPLPSLLSPFLCFSVCVWWVQLLEFGFSLSHWWRAETRCWIGFCSHCPGNQESEATSLSCSSAVTSWENWLSLWPFPIPSPVNTDMVPLSNCLGTVWDINREESLLFLRCGRSGKITNSSNCSPFKSKKESLWAEQAGEQCVFGRANLITHRSSPLSNWLGHFHPIVSRGTMY